jgi:hypothetical protein
MAIGLLRLETKNAYDFSRAQDRTWERFCRQRQHGADCASFFGLEVRGAVATLSERTSCRSGSLSLANGRASNAATLIGLSASTAAPTLKLETVKALGEEALPMVIVAAPPRRDSHNTRSLQPVSIAPSALTGT